MQSSRQPSPTPNTNTHDTPEQFNILLERRPSEQATMTDNLQGKDLAPLFSKEDEEDGDFFRDRIRCLFEHFDKDCDGHLNFTELSALQKATEGVILSEEMYLMTCRTLNCQPGKGISLGALKVTYASDGANVDKDYYKVFPDRKTKKGEGKREEDHIYEVGEDGFDISS